MTSTIFPIFLIGFVVMENIFLWNYSQALFYVFTHLVTVVSLFYLTFICKTSYLRKNKKLGWQYISFKNLHLKTHYFTQKNRLYKSSHPGSPYPDDLTHIEVLGRFILDR